MSTLEANLRSKAWDNVIHSYGTFAVFGERVKKLRKARILRDFFGVALPLILGFFAANVIGSYQFILLYILSFLALSQLLFTVWSIISQWDDTYYYARNASRENEGMFQEWERAAKSSSQELEAAVEKAEKRDDLMQERDRGQNITDVERQYGMRRALMYRQKKCAVCCKIPVNMKATNCSCCG